MSRCSANYLTTVGIPLVDTKQVKPHHFFGLQVEVRVYFKGEPHSQQAARICCMIAAPGCYQTLG